MTREADYTLKGFIYQFNKTLEQLLNDSVGSKITVEGIVEDIDIFKDGKTKAIQCKYHETKKKFNLSDITKPILQMLVHYSENKQSNIKYILYSFFPNEKQGKKSLTKLDIENILNTKNRSYIVKYISKIIPPTDTQIIEILQKPKKNSSDRSKIIDYYNSNPTLTPCVEVTDFLDDDRFEFTIGESFSDLEKEVKNLLLSESTFSDNDITDIFYPNAIQKIAKKSILHNSSQRFLYKKSFLEELETTKKTAISRWTKELTSYLDLLKIKRNQLKTNLQSNHRSRYFVFNAEKINNFEGEIVRFISDYINKYHHKIKLHTMTPIFCIFTKNHSLIPEIESRLHTKGVSCNNGIKGNTFFENEFLREPERITRKSWFEFQLRICDYNDNTINAINNKKCDDLFIIGDIETSKFNKQDLNIERIEIPKLSELKYLILLTDNIG